MNPRNSSCDPAILHITFIFQHCQTLTAQVAQLFFNWHSTREMSNHPNFPTELDIHPLVSDREGENSVFESVQQERAIQKYGIAGRVW